MSSRVNAPDVAEHLEQIARALSLPIPAGFRFLSFVQGKNCTLV